MQTTIKSPISCYGIGIHSGRETQMTLKQAPAGSGIMFVRTDITGLDNKIMVSSQNVNDTLLSTSVSNNAGVKISTIEHLMAALWGCGLDNAIVEIDGPEVPIMDGSSKPFVFMIECAGKKLLHQQKKSLKLLKKISVIDDGCVIEAYPSEQMSIDLTIDFQSSAIGKQNMIFSDISTFKEEIADSRTFGFVHELNYLKSKGLAKGASLDNAIGIDQDVILNHEGLRHKDEFVRHKMLDFFGDLFTCGGNFIGNINAYKTSHALNNQFLRKLFSDPYAYQWI